MARSSTPLAIQAHTHILTLQPTDPSNWTIPPDFQTRFCNPLVVRGASSDKRKRAQSPDSTNKKRDSNDALFICNNFNSAKGCSWSACQQAHKCKKCGETSHRQSTCTRKAWRVGSVRDHSASDNEIITNFLDAYPCISALPRPNTTPTFKLVDATQSPLLDSPSPLSPTAWAQLLEYYPGPLRFHLPMILRFGTSLGYVGAQQLTLSQNLPSADADPDTITLGFTKDILLGRVLKVTPSFPYISSSLGLVPKSNGGWRRIHHLSHSKHISVNDGIPDEAVHLKYASLQEVLDLVLSAGQGALILKQDIKDAFWNIPVAPQYC